MKKLILVTMLAVAASWLLSEPRRPGDLTAALDEFKARHGDVPRQRVALDDGETRFAPIRPPESPEPPGAIRTIPWRPARETAEARAPKPGSNRPGPSWFPRSEADEAIKAKPDASGLRVLLGRLSASESRAREDLRKIVEGEVTSWLADDVPPSWKPPAGAIDAMVRGSYTRELTKDLLPAAEAGPKPDEPEAVGLFTLYRAGQQLDFSPGRRADLIGIYHRELAAARTQRLGGGLALALVGLAVLSGYIRADEATKGYYTNRLRLAAAAGMGAAGVAAYRFLA